MSPNRATSQIKENLHRVFTETMGTPPDIVCFAPGRVNLIGEHIDYNGGHVFPCALTLGTYGAACARKDDRIRLYSLDFPQNGVIESSLSGLNSLADMKWGKYVLGVVLAFLEKGFPIPHGFDFVCQGTLPTKAGLSSSASLEVLAGTILRALFRIGNAEDPSELPLLAQRAENQYVGMNCGIMDQFASANGKADHAILLDCASLEFRYAPLNLDGYQIVISNTNKPHELVDSAYNDRRRECEDALRDLRTVIPSLPSLCALTPEQFEKHAAAIQSEISFRRARHAVTEEARTMAAFEALQRNDLSAFGHYMNESHVSLRDDFEVSCSELDYLTELAWDHASVLGSRMTGGGFGGCTVSIVKKEDVPQFIEYCGTAYRKTFGYDASFYTVTAGSGAGILP